jgi:hypothetical protein
LAAGSSSRATISAKASVGLITAARIEAELRPAGFDWITALRAPAIQRLVTDGPLQLSLFDARDLAEIASPDYPGERLIVCQNRCSPRSGRASAATCSPPPKGNSPASRVAFDGHVSRCAVPPRSARRSAPS